jgi:hypothetical protein
MRRPHPKATKKMRRPVKGLLAVLPLAFALRGCIDSAADLSASTPPAFPIAEGFYKAVNDPKSPAFKIVRSGSDYRAVDPAQPDDKGAVFALMDPDHSGVFIAEDKTGAKDIKPPRYVYYFVRVLKSGERVDLYDFTEADWRLLPADLKQRLKPGASVSIADDADAAAVLRAIERRLAARPTLRKTTFRLVRRLDKAER